MPTTKVVNQATSANAMNGLDFEDVRPGTVLELAASGVTAGDTISLSVGSQKMVVDAQVNIESSADVVDPERDHIALELVRRAGKVFLPVTATTAVNFTLFQYRGAIARMMLRSGGRRRAA